MYKSAFSYIFPTWFLHYKYVFVPKTMEFDQIIILKSFFCCHKFVPLPVKQITMMSFMGILNLEMLSKSVNKFYNKRVCMAFKYINPFCKGFHTIIPIISNSFKKCIVIKNV